MKQKPQLLDSDHPSNDVSFFVTQRVFANILVYTLPEYPGRGVELYLIRLSEIFRLYFDQNDL